MFLGTPLTTCRETSQKFRKFEHFILVRDLNSLAPKNSLATYRNRNGHLKYKDETQRLIRELLRSLQLNGHPRSVGLIFAQKTQKHEGTSQMILSNKGPRLKGLRCRETAWGVLTGCHLYFSGQGESKN